MTVTTNRGLSPEGPSAQGAGSGAQPRVAVIDHSSSRRAMLTRSVVEQAALELVLSSGCLADAVAIRETPDIVMLGACARHHPGCDSRRLLEDRGCRILRLAPMDGPPNDGPSARSRARDREDAPPCAHRQGVWGAEPQPPLPALSDRERRTLELYVSGMTLAQVATVMFVTPNTAATYLKRIRAKLREVGLEAESKLALRDLAPALGVVQGASHGASDDWPAPPR